MGAAQPLRSEDPLLVPCQFREPSLAIGHFATRGVGQPIPPERLATTERPRDDEHGGGKSEPAKDGKRVAQHAAIAVVERDRSEAPNGPAGGVPCEELTE